MKRRLLIALTVLATLVLTVYAASRLDEYYRETRSSVNLFADIYSSIVESYVDVVDPEPLIQAAVDGMLDELDPYTAFFDQQGTERLRDRSRGEYGGLGMRVGLQGEERRITIIAPFNGTPASRAGLRSGDVIIAVDSIDVTGMPLDEAVTYMRGEPGTPIRMQIDRPGQGEMVFDLVRDVITLHDVQLATILDEGTAYLKLNSFSENAARDLETALVDLRLQGMEALILDLRSNPGGLLSSAVAVSDLFLPHGATIVSTRGRNGELIEEYTGDREAILPPDIPLLVLINQGTASASEIVSGALQDHDRALILGSNSFGKGLVQGVINLPDERALKITKARYYLPSGRLIQRVDYFRDNETLDHSFSSSNLTSDTLFYSLNGRELLSGRGIVPDIEVTRPVLSRFTGEVWRQRQLFDYLTSLEAAGNLPESVEVTPTLLDGLEEFLLENSFELPPLGIAELDSLAAKIERSEYPPGVARALETLRAELESNVPQEFARNRTEIEQLLLLELADRLGGDSGRARANLLQDPVLDEALALLEEQERLYSLLNVATEGKE